MIVRPLTVGPIVGATTGRTVRIWGRGELEYENGAPRKCWGVARLRQAGASNWRKPRLFRMNPNFDLTGIVVFEDLLPEKLYEYQIGYIIPENELDPNKVPPPLDWLNITGCRFKTAAIDATRERSFVFGSCRYLLRLFGGVWFDDRGDKTFRSILDQIEKTVQTDALLMIGDQIYADDLLFAGIDTTLGDFLKRYRNVFEQPYIRKLMSCVPTYMTLDDHEIEDGWPANASPRDWVTKYPVAMHACLTYQFSHSPLFELNEANRITGTPEKLWYTFHDGCCDFFMTETRTERYLTNDEETREIINKIQMDALKQWLNDGSGRVKFIASATMVFPDTRTGSPDAWGGFLRQRSELLDFIRTQKIRRVVFLSGDVHCSQSAELVSPLDPDFKVISVVSSPFFWPYPHMQETDFVLSGSLRTFPSSENYTVQNAGPVFSLDNFTRINVNLNRIQVEVYDRKGILLGNKEHEFS